MLNPIQERFQAQEEKEIEQAAENEINNAFDELFADDQNKDLPEDARDAIEALAYRYTDNSGLTAKEIIGKGLDDYKALIAQGEKSLFSQKDKQPQTPEGPGAASTAPEAITQFGDPRLKAQALERLKQS